MKRVLITGAGGAIGCHVLNKILKETNWNVVITDSFRHKGFFDRVSVVMKWNPGKQHRIETITHDLTAPFSQREINSLRGIDYIINMASLSDVQDSIDNPAPFIRNNIDLVINMLELAREIKPQMFIQFSTDEVAGPCSPDFPGHGEWCFNLPSNPYAASKAAQEDIAISYWRSYDVPVVITRTMNNFSTMQGASKYPIKIQKAVEAGEELTVHAMADGSIGSRFYIDSEMAAEALLFIINNTTAYRHRAGYSDMPDRYNVVGDERIDNLQLAQMIADIMGKPLRYRMVNFHDSNPGHDSHYGLDGSKLRNIGFIPSKSMRDCLAEVVSWQQAHPEWID